MSKRLLVVTNLYPPQELGGYGRCISDFVFGLSGLGYFIHIVCSDAPYLHKSSGFSYGINGEFIHRILKLNGSYENGVSYVTDRQQLIDNEKFNKRVISRHLDCNFDAILVGNIDLIGTSVLSHIISSGLPVLHHIGFIRPPFNISDVQVMPNYQIISASFAVRESLKSFNFPVDNTSIVYPGVRCELFSLNLQSGSVTLRNAVSLDHNGFPLGSISNPLKIGYAGLLMGSKGAHTVVQALILLKRYGICFQAMFAGSEFQSSYLSQLTKMLDDSGLFGTYQFVGQLDRFQLSRFWRLQHVGVFPSIYPEAFGIVAAEIMASGIVLLTTGVGGSSELIEDGISGLLFPPDNPECLAKLLVEQVNSPNSLISLATHAQKRVQTLFDVGVSSKKLDMIFKSMTQKTDKF